MKTALPGLPANYIPQLQRIVPPASIPNGDPLNPGLPAQNPSPGDPRIPPQRTPAYINPSRGAPYPVWPGYDDCVRALIQAREASISTSTLAPHIYPYINSRFISDSVRVVVNVNAGVDPIANLGGARLHVAESQFGTVTLIVPPTAAVPYPALTIYELQSPQGFVTFINRWGVTVENGRREMVELFASVTGPQSFGVTPPNVNLSGQAAVDQEQTLLALPENSRLLLQIRNNDTCSAALVTFSFTGWTIKSGGKLDLKEIALPQRGYAVDCFR